jgi:hypothetical protein
MHWVSEIFLPRLFTDDQKLQQFYICENLLQTLLPVMRHGFTVMTLRPNNNPDTGRFLLHLAPRKRDKCTRKRKQYCLFFYHWGIVHYEFAPEVQTIRILICLFWDVYGMRYKESNMKCGLLEAGSFVTIMHLLTQHCQLENSWQNIQFLPFDNRPIHLTSPLPTFFYSLNSKLPLMEEDFRQWKTSSLMQQMTWRRNHKHPFEQCFQKWKRWWERCIAVQGDYFEGDNIQ